MSKFSLESSFIKIAYPWKNNWLVKLSNMGQTSGFHYDREATSSEVEAQKMETYSQSQGYSQVNWKQELMGEEQNKINHI